MDYSNRRLSVLGSTGSIGTQTLEVCRLLGVPVAALCANKNITLLEAQIREFKPSLAAVMDEEAAKKLAVAVADLPVKVVSGMEGFIEAATFSGCDMVLNSVVGMVGLRPTLAALEAGKRFALANKETLVAGGALVTGLAKANGIEILPVDSEHSAIFQCLQAAPESKAFKKIILTASGGPFFGKTRAELASVKKEQALKHPNWDMGAKITIDSSTMMNKGLEVIEAAWLFGKSVEDIEVVVHRESIIHSAVEFCDNSVIAQLGLPDMRIPIQYAISFPERAPSPAKPLSLADIGTLSFYKPDEEAFPCLAHCKDAFCKGGVVPAAANGANEKAVELFLCDKIGYNDISDLVGETIAECCNIDSPKLEDVLAADIWAREFVEKKAKTL